MHFFIKVFEKIAWCEVINCARIIFILNGVSKIFAVSDGLIHFCGNEVCFGIFCQLHRQDLNNQVIDRNETHWVIFQ